MIGLSILLAVVFYVWLARFVARRIENRAAKYAVIAIFILIPTWDVIPGKLYFNHLCENEAGLKIYKVVEGVEGYRVYPGTATGLGPGPEGFKKYGYKFEERGSGSDFFRYTFGPDGKVQKQAISESIARYAARGTLTPLHWGVTKSEVVVFDQQTMEKLAVNTGFSAHGNWLIRLLFRGAPTTSAYCRSSESDLYLRTLKPAKSTN